MSDSQHQDVPVYKRKLEPKIIKEDLVNQTPHFIDIPIPYEKPVCVWLEEIRKRAKAEYTTGIISRLNAQIVLFPIFVQG